MKKQLKLGQVGVGSNITQDHSSSLKEVNYVWSLFSQIHMKSWKLKLDQV